MTSEPIEYGMSDVRDFFRAKNEVTYGSGKLSDLLSGVAEGTQSAYRTAWIQWSHFMENRPEGVWIEKQEPKWDERLIEWILFETRILGVQVGTIRSKISAVRYRNILSGYPDFFQMDWQIQTSIEEHIAKTDSEKKTTLSTWNCSKWPMQN